MQNAADLFLLFEASMKLLWYVRLQPLTEGRVASFLLSSGVSSLKACYFDGNTQRGHNSPQEYNGDDRMKNTI